MQLQRRNLHCPIGNCPQGYTELVGHDEVVIEEGREIEIIANGSDILKAEVPEHHHWKVNVSIDIIEY